MTPEEICLKIATKHPKSKTVKMPNWTREEQRPSDAHFIAWEIYAGNDLVNEHDCIVALQSLREKGIIELQLVGSTIWWRLIE